MELFNVTGENILTGNTWHFAGPMSKSEAVDICKGATRLESDYKVVYVIERVEADA